MAPKAVIGTAHVSTLPEHPEPTSMSWRCGRCGATWVSQATEAIIVRTGTCPACEAPEVQRVDEGAAREWDATERPGPCSEPADDRRTQRTQD